jgi:metal-dependent hydrolase (beta-lactamase superfamily II)
MEADEERIAKTLKELKGLGICIAGLCHCSGDLAREMISEDESLSGCQIHVGGVVFL